MSWTEQMRQRRIANMRLTELKRDTAAVWTTQALSEILTDIISLPGVTSSRTRFRSTVSFTRELRCVAHQLPNSSNLKLLIYIITLIKNDDDVNNNKAKKKTTTTKCNLINEHARRNTHGHQFLKEQLARVRQTHLRDLERARVSSVRT